MLACICHLIFFCHNTLFFSKKYCVVASLSQHNIFGKNNVLWQKNKMADTCHHMKRLVGPAETAVAELLRAINAVRRSVTIALMR